MRALIDWLQFTLPRPSELSSELLDDQLFYVFNLLGIPQTEFKMCKTGGNGYKKRTRFQNISVFWDGSPEMGVHVVLTGQGCRAYERWIVEKKPYPLEVDKNGEYDASSVWRGLLGRILKYSDKFSRIDGAIDDFKTYFKLLEIDRKIDEGVCTSLFSESRTIKSRDISTGELKGLTIYLGSVKSDVQIVCYDKYLERKAKDKEFDENISNWNRFECRFKNDHAYQVVKKIMEGNQSLGKYLHSVIHRYFNILQPVKGDTNRSRWGYWKHWARFLGAVEKAEFELVKPEKTLEDSIEAARKQLPRWLARIDEADANIIPELVGLGKTKFTDKDVSDIEVYTANEIAKAYEEAEKFEDEDDQLVSEFNGSRIADRQRDKKNQPYKAD